MLIPRSRGAVSGVLLIIMGTVGALIPLVGPYFDFTIGATDAWNLGEGHLWLSVVPGIAVVVAALLLTLSANRATAGLGAWLALAGGVWFVIGEQISQLWNNGGSIAGAAAGGTGQRVAEQLVFYDGIGVTIAALAAFALGRLAVRSVRDAELAAAAADDDRVVIGRDERRVIDEDPDAARFDRDRDLQPVAVDAPDERDDDTLTAADRVRLAADDGTTTSTAAAVRRRQGGLIGRFRR